MERHRAGQGGNEYRPGPSRLACGAAADTERVRELTTTHRKRTTWQPALRADEGIGPNNMDRNRVGQA
ncbi:MAG: hypothetical protein ACI4P4_11215 [Faecousia sp.]